MLVQIVVEATPGQLQLASAAPPPITPALGVSGDAPAAIAAVYSAEEFQDAFHAGIRDIEIHAHIDLRDLEEPSTPITDSHVFYFIGTAGPSTRSIRVCAYCCCLLIHMRNATSEPGPSDLPMYN